MARGRGGRGGGTQDGEGREGRVGSAQDDVGRETGAERDVRRQGRSGMVRMGEATPARVQEGRRGWWHVREEDSRRACAREGRRKRGARERKAGWQLASWIGVVMGHELMNLMLSTQF
jgi:hypothetical protein